MSAWTIVSQAAARFADAPGGVFLLFKATALLGAAWAAHAALAGRNPRWRVVLWRGTAVGLVMLPTLVLTPPVVAWRLPTPERPADGPTPEKNLAVLRVPPHPVEPAQTAWTEPTVVTPVDGGTRLAGVTREAHSPRPPDHVSPPPLGGVRPSTGFALGWRRVLVGAWALGVVLLAVRLWLGTRRLSRLVGRAEAVPSWVAEECRTVAARLGVGGVPVVASAEVSTPFLTGLRRPVLVLPVRSCRDGDHAELRAVLAHELAHARGGDLVWNGVLHVGSVLLWFHPLAWRVRAAHADACDAVCDAVAADLLGDVGSYSRSLARLALRAAGVPPAAGLAMARSCDVRRRVEALQRRLFHAPLPGRLVVPAAFAFSLAIVLIGGLRLTRAGQGPAVPAGGASPRPQRAANGPAAAPAPLVTLSPSGTVVDADGKPVAGAKVILREWTSSRARGMQPKDVEPLLRGKELPDILAETTTDAAGAFRFDKVDAPAFPRQDPRFENEESKTVFPWDLVALAPGRGLAWVQLTPRAQRTPLTLSLGPERPLLGRVVEPGGTPVRGAKVKVVSVDPTGRPIGNGLATENRLNLLWSSVPLGATTDADGRFTVAGLPADRVVTLVVTEPGHERLYAFAATTETPQPDDVSRTFRDGQAEEERRPVHTGTFTLTARRTDHVLTGRVLRETDGKPAAGARVFHAWTDTGKVGDDGVYRIEGLTSGAAEVHASLEGSDVAPLDLKVEIPDEPKEVRRDLVLPRGLIVTGRVIDGATGRGVAKAAVDFRATPTPGRMPSFFGFSKETDADGRFRLVVPPTAGTVTLVSVPPDYPALERGITGQAANPQWSRAVDGRGAQTVAVADFRMSSSRGLVLQAVDPAGRPVPKARVDVRDFNRWPENRPGSADEQGRYEATGLPPGQTTVVDVTSEELRLGATVEVDVPPADRPGPGKSIEVRLRPLVALSGRVLDGDGKPLPGAQVQLYRDVTSPGQSGRSFGLPIGSRYEAQADGSYSFDGLIPGATYNTQVEAEGFANSSSNHVTVKPGQPVRVDDFRLPAAVQELRGVVVDAGGKAVAGVSVSYERRDPSRALYAPRGATWFQDTDAAGRFHLTGLPRGPVRLMVYRHTEGAGRPIRDMKYVDVAPGRADVRVELPAPNDRLRGIE